MNPEVAYVAPLPFNVISLFAGIGGLDLGLRLAVPTARCVCYVEGEAYAAAVLAARMAEGALDEAPIWSDVRSFDGRRWRGLVDCIVGGFPCQDISDAGQKAGIGGARSGLWSEYARIINEVQPRYVFIENVAALARRGLSVVLHDLAALGFDAEWDCFAASEAGAPHRRQRIFILAWRRDAEHHLEPERVPDPDGLRLRERPERGPSPPRLPQPGHPELGNMGQAPRVGDPDGGRHQGPLGTELPSLQGGQHQPAGGSDRQAGGAGRGLLMADACVAGLEGGVESGRHQRPSRPPVGGCGGPAVADADEPRCDQQQGVACLQGGTGERGCQPDPSGPDAPDGAERRGLADPPRLRLPRAPVVEHGRPELAVCGAAPMGRAPWPPGPLDADGWREYLAHWPGLEPAVCRGADGLAHRVDRLRALGNAVVPQQAALAWDELWTRSFQAPAPFVPKPPRAAPTPRKAPSGDVYEWLDHVMHRVYG